jgi:hypothetical protein
MPKRTRTVTKDEAIALAEAMVSGQFAGRIRTDVSVYYSADAWVYIAQHASVALTSIALNILSTYLYERARTQGEVRLENLLTREVKEGIAVYRRAIEQLREYKADDTKAQELIDVYVVDTAGVLPLLEGGRARDINLLELLEHFRTMSAKERKKLANRSIF